MDSTMFQLRSFVHQRLYTAAEEILGEVEKTITLALYQAQVSRSKEELEGLRHQLDLLRKKPAETPSLTCSTVEHEDECEKPGPSTPEESKFSLGAEIQGSPQTSTDMDNKNWNYCVVRVGEVSLHGSLPESPSNRNTTHFQEPTESNKGSDNEVLCSLSSQVQLPTNYPEPTSLKMPRRMKRKRTTGPNSQGNSLDPPEKTPSTQHTPTATPAPSTPKIFKEICSILPLSSGGKKKRCKITVEELARRVGPPEYMSFSSLAAYLRTDNNARKELQVQLDEAGIKPTEITTEMSLFSRLCEEEVEALCESLAGQVRDHLPFQGLYIITEAEDEVDTLERLSEFRSHLRRAIAAIKERVEAVDLASHGFMSKMLDIMLSIFEKCLDKQMSSIY